MKYSLPRLEAIRQSDFIRQLDLSALAPLFQFIRQAALLPVLLPLLAFLVAKSYLHLSAISLIEQLQQRLPASVQLSYADIDSRFDGRIKLQQARLLLAGMNLPLAFDSLVLNLEHWRDWDESEQLLLQQQLPAALEFDFQLITESLPHLASAEALPVELARLLLGCGSGVSQSADQPVLGEPIEGHFSYRFEPRSEYLNVDLKLSAKQQFEFQLRGDLDIGAEQLQLASLSQAALGALQFEFFNLGSQSRLMTECGARGRSGLIEGLYVAKLSKIAKHRLLQLGWHSSDELELAYQDYLFQPVKMAVAFNSRKPIALKTLIDEPQGWQRYQSQVVLNRYQSEPGALQWQWQAPQLAAAPIAPVEESVVEAQQQEPLVEKEAAIESVFAPPSVVEPDLEPQQPYQPSFKPVPVRQLNRHIGDVLRLKTHNGRAMEGVLEKLEPGMLQLRRDVAYGVAVVPVRLEIISSAQAYF